MGINISKAIDLHLHLDGAISLKSARELARLQQISIPESDEELTMMMRVSPDCTNLNEFLEKFEFPCSLLQTEIGIETAMFNLCEELSDRDLAYAEVRFAPSKCCDKGLTQEQVVRAAVKGMKRSKMNCRLILCCMRGDNDTVNKETIQVAKQFIADGVVGVDLAGAEALYPTKWYEDLFKFARELDVPFTIHAGEAAGAESILAAIDMGARRIGHGTHSMENPEVIEKLANRQIPVEMCPTSNLQTHAIENIEDLPLRKFIEAGILVTINTDDPTIEGTTIYDEWQKVIETFNLTDAEIRQLRTNSIKASFLSDEEKKKLQKELENYIQTIN